MKAIKFIFFSVLMFSASYLFIACDAIEKATTVEIPIDLSFNIPFSLDSKSDVRALRSGNEESLTHFSGVSTISLDSPQFAKLKEYKDFPITLLISNVKIKITVKDGSGTTVKDFESLAKIDTTLLASYTKAEADLGIEFSDPALTNYLKTIITSVQTGKTVTVSVSGNTDINPSETEGVEVGFISIIGTITAQVSLLK
jgi:hypothetical protein